MLAGIVSRFCRLLGFSALPLAACADLLGDVAVGQAPDSPSAVESSPDSVVTVPLQVDPTPIGSETLPAIPVLDVGSASGSQGEEEEQEQAEPPAPPPLCEAGSFRCSGADVEFCLNGSSWIFWQTCGSPRLCQSEPAGRCIPALCAAGQQRCLDGSLQRCDEELSGWTELEQCVTAAHCDPRQSECLGAPCEPGQQRCNGEQLEACSDDQLGWVALEQCASAALCQSGAEPGTAACLPPSCSEGEFRCAGSGALQVCNPELTGFNNVAQCATAALCDAEQGRCEAPACNPGQHACTPAGELLLCNDARSGFRAQQPAIICSETETCDAVRGVCEPIPLPPPPPPPPMDEDDDEDEERPRGRDRDREDDDDRRGRNRGDD